MTATTVTTMATAGVAPRLRDAGIALAAVVAAWVVLAWPWLVDGLTIPWDAKLHFLAMARWLGEHLAKGDWPLWMPESFGGRPALGDPQSMMLSPGYLALAAIDPVPSARAADAVVLVEVLLGGLATTLFAWRRGWHPAAAVLAALVMMVGASASSRLQHTLLVQSHAFVPVVLLALDAALDRPTPWRGVLAGVALGMLAVGRDQVAYLALIGLAAFVVARIVAASDRRAFVRARLAAGGIALLMAGAIAAVPILATIEFAEISNRPAFEFDYGTRQSMPPSGFLTMLVPNLFGSLTSDGAYWGPGSGPWKPWVAVDRTVVQLYTGAVAAVLIVWVGLLRGRLLHGAGWLLFGLGAFYTLYALGHYTPLFRVLFDHLPGVDKFRRPADASYPIGAIAALAAGWLCDRVIREGIPRAPLRRVGVEVAVALGLVAAAGWVAHSHAKLPDAAPAIAVSLLLSVLVVGLLVQVGATGAATGDRRRRLALLALVVLSVLDLRAFTVGTPLNARPLGPFALLDDPEDVPLARWLEREVAAIEAREGPVRAEVMGLGGPWQNAPIMLGVESTLGYNPLRLADYDTAIGAKQNSHWWPARKFGTLMTGYRSDFADLLGVRLIVLGVPMEKVDPASVPAFAPPRRIGSGWVYENPRAVPRAVFVGLDGARPHDPESLVASGKLPALDWRHEALIDPLPEAVPDPVTDPAPAGTVRIVSRGADRVALDVTAARGGFVVLHDLAYPGWVAYVDGVREEPRRANVLFMAAPVPAGRHAVTFAYEPLAPGHLWALLAGLE